MGDLRSAWEIALERAERLGGISAEERRRQDEDRDSLVGKALAERYLAGEFDMHQLKAEVERHEEGRRRGVIGAVVSGLARAIEIGDCGRG
ncbi:hypothetical protein ACFLX5_02420 [Chloroflexota bacterium]